METSNKIIVERNVYVVILFPLDKTIYEFYGDFWHVNPKIYHINDLSVSNKKSFGELYTLTLLREQQLISFGYKITSIWESDWNQMEK